MSRRSGGRGSEWISRQIASFGRYPDKRPQGLHAEANGALSLKSLMQNWGRSQGLSEEEVLTALRDNMTYETGAPRFEIDGNGSNACIRVFTRSSSRRGGWQQQKNGSSNADHWQHDNRADESWWSGGSASSHRHQEGGSGGGHASDDAADSGRPVASPNRTFNVFGPKASSNTGEGVWASRADDDSKSKKEDGDSWWRREAWWADTGDDRRKKEAPEKNGAWESVEAKTEDRKDGKSWSWSEGEPVQRWLGWVLKTGHRDVGIWLEDGEWASLDVLAEVLSSSKPEFNVWSADDIKKMLADTDQAGRFEISKKDDTDHLRKVRRDSRVGRADDGNNRSWGKSWGSDSRGSQRATWQKEERQEEAVSSPKSHTNWDSPQRSRRESPQRSRRDASEEPPAKRRHVEPQPQGQAPPKPPGEHWKKYVDGETYWWYYEGPLGKWWIPEANGDPEPWPEDDDDDDDDDDDNRRVQ